MKGQSTITGASPLQPRYLIDSAQRRNPASRGRRAIRLTNVNSLSGAVLRGMFAGLAPCRCGMGEARSSSIASPIAPGINRLYASKTTLAALSNHPLYYGMDQRMDPVGYGRRDSNELVTATRMMTGTDVNYAALKKDLLDSLRRKDGFSIEFFGRVVAAVGCSCAVGRRLIG